MKHIFGNQSESIHFEPSRKERLVSSSEDWSAAILSGSDTNQVLERPIKTKMSKVLLFVVGGVAALLSIAIFNLQVVNGAKNQALADGNRIRERIVPAPRGVMYDRNGQLVVQNLANFDLIVTPTLLPRSDSDRQHAYDTVAKLTSMPSQDVKQKAESKGLISSTNILVAEKVPRDTALLLDEQSRNTPGFTLNATPSREYLDNGSLSHFLGYIGRISPDDLKSHKEYRATDFIGQMGLERSYEQFLKGSDGSEKTEVEASGKPVRLLASTDPKPGDNLVLAIDKDLQLKTAQALADGAAKAGSQSAVAIALNPQNGEILAAVNYPGYDNNLFAKGISNADYQGLLNNPAKPLFNKIALGTYPIGSTIKPLMASAALQEGVITTSTTIEDKGKIEVPNIYNPSIVQIFKGWKPEGLGSVNVFRAIAWSSDVFFYTIGGGFGNFKGLGAHRVTDYLQKFGFGHKTGIDLPAEAAGYVPTPESKLARTRESWNIGDTYNISIGQGNLLVSPLQLAVATSAVANGGTLYKPHLVHKIVSPDGNTVKDIKPEAVRSNFISPENLAIVRSGMEQTVESGTACCSIKTQVPVKVAGKTGTAETATQDAQGKSVTKPHAWFTAYAPADNPQIVVVVLVEYAGEGAEYAVPVAREILKSYFIR